MKNRKHRAVEVCLCLLCILLLTAVMVLCVYFTTERNHLITHINNLTEERKQIFTKYEQILNHSNNLTAESKQIKNKIDELQRGLYEQGYFIFILIKSLKNDLLPFHLSKNKHSLKHQMSVHQYCLNKFQHGQS